VAGAIVGVNIGFGIGHWGGYRLLVRYGKYLRLDQARLKVGRYLFYRHGGKVDFFGRFVSVLRTYAAFLAGTNRMPWGRFLIFNASGGILWATLYGLGAYYLGHEIERVGKPVGIAIAAAAVNFLENAVPRRSPRNAPGSASRRRRQKATKRCNVGSFRRCMRAISTLETPPSDFLDRYRGEMLGS
jgi:membrane protein DedA with SNARE-associated domain